MKVLNLYAGIGGNRKRWPEDVKVTAVEYREDIAAVYRHYFPNDTIVVADAHEYLLNNYKKFDLIWTSRPCTTHSRANFWGSKNADNRKKYYPDMGLYQEILFLQHWCDDKRWVAENVVPYYDPLIPPKYKIGRHIFWTNFRIPPIKVEEADIKDGKRDEWSKLFGFDLSKFKIDTRKDQIYRNCVHPDLGLHILNAAMNKQTPLNQKSLFDV